MATSDQVWRALGASVRGAAHVRTERPNQDAWRCWSRSGVGPPLVLAVADGHGGHRYVRSHLGAGYAVRTATEILAHDLLALIPAEEAALDLVYLKRTTEEWLPRVLVRRWRARVERHLRRWPLHEAEMRCLRQGRRNEEEVDPVEAYGATVLAVLLTRWFHLYLQLGDGDILTVSAQGQVSRPPLPLDRQLLGNETTSLCSPQAWRSVRLLFQPLVENTPDLIMLATDGYANSFVDDAAFEQVGVDLWRIINQDGCDLVSTHLPAWLQDTSASGSGDDITIALAVREEQNGDAD